MLSKLQFTSSDDHQFRRPRVTCKKTPAGSLFGALHNNLYKEFYNQVESVLGECFQTSM